MAAFLYALGEKRRRFPVIFDYQYAHALILPVSRQNVRYGMVISASEAAWLGYRRVKCGISGILTSLGRAAHRSERAWCYVAPGRIFRERRGGCAWYLQGFFA